MPQRLPSRLWPAILTLVAACGSSSTGPSTPPDKVGDISIVNGAEFLTTAAFDPNPKTVSLADGGGVRWVNGDPDHAPDDVGQRGFSDLGPHPGGRDVQHYVGNGRDVPLPLRHSPEHGGDDHGHPLGEHTRRGPADRSAVPGRQVPRAAHLL